MPDYRSQFALTQQQLAQWLGVSRSTVAAFERGARAVPRLGLQGARLDVAYEGLTLDAPSNEWRTMPPQPLPIPETQGLTRQLRECRYRADRLRFELENLRLRAVPYEARYRALPALRAWNGPVPDDARTARWIDGFEAEAQHELTHVCGPVQQRLLEARLAGQEREAEMLTQALADLGAAPEPQ